MVVDGQIDSELGAELVDRVKIVLIRLGHERFDAHLLGELEMLPVVAADAEIDHFDAGIGQFLQNLLAIRRRHVGAHDRGRFLLIADRG